MSPTFYIHCSLQTPFNLKPLLFMWIESYKVSEQPKRQPWGYSPSVIHFCPACHLFPGVIRNPCWSCKCHLKSDRRSHPAAQHPRTLPAPRAARQSSVYKSGNLSIPKPSFLGIHLFFRGWHRNLGIGIRKATLAKGCAAGTWVRRKRTGRKGWSLETAVDSNGLQDPHLVFRPPLWPAWLVF